MCRDRDDLHLLRGPADRRFLALIFMNTCVRRSVHFVVPNNGTPASASQNANSCNAQATAAMQTQPDATPGFQDVMDAFWGAALGYVFGGGTMGSAAKGAGLGLVYQGTGHTLQQGWAYQGALNSCYSNQGINTGNYTF